MGIEQDVSVNIDGKEIPIKKSAIDSELIDKLRSKKFNNGDEEFYKYSDDDTTAYPVSNAAIAKYFSTEGAYPGMLDALQSVFSENPGVIINIGTNVMNDLVSGKKALEEMLYLAASKQTSINKTPMKK